MKRATGMTGATGLRLVMVVPQLHRPEHGDPSECILLWMKITQNEMPCAVLLCAHSISQEGIYPSR